MNKLKFLLTTTLLITNFLTGICQVYFPFDNEKDDSSLLAYWYNCRPDSVKIVAFDQTGYFNSSLQVYGPVIADSFEVKVDVFLPGNIPAYSNTFTVQKRNPAKNPPYKVSFVDNYFRIMTPVDQLSSDPEMIKVTMMSLDKKMEKTIFPTYHKISGHMKDFNGKPLRSFILIQPDAFEDACGVWSDENGYYEITLPERVYNSFYVNDGNYKSTTLEAWSWHMIVDHDQVLDYKIGTGEVYNLNVWPNNGGYNSLLISFRPMILRDKDFEDKTRMINDKTFKWLDSAPQLDIKDFTITINGQETEIYSIQPYLETGEDYVMSAYLIQVRQLSPTFGKQTIMVEYNKTEEKDSKLVQQNSMGYFQFFVNYSGESAF